MDRRIAARYPPTPVDPSRSVAAGAVDLHLPAGGSVPLRAAYAVRVPHEISHAERSAVSLRSFHRSFHRCLPLRMRRRTYRHLLFRAAQICLRRPYRLIGLVPDPTDRWFRSLPSARPPFPSSPFLPPPSARRGPLTSFFSFDFNCFLAFSIFFNAATSSAVSASRSFDMINPPFFAAALPWPRRPCALVQARYPVRPAAASHRSEPLAP